ncbi:aminoglycoside phosphotransferase family protein [Streptomyces sp. NBC_01142]|uniref:aminoglycoside phosphotransferase family protein n=1 Tax=Streptomyces sp. NBC_01142 TaxID=2975865 RepID=UPI00225AA5FC|nr:aminoglycoside phosphotransferase family protein [Streptomyces sp. NBC_01142]MCX4819085.1 aminoglycoside phosphotransferase family protein [Streptomyces sp. NBC_01142]
MRMPFGERLRDELGTPRQVRLLDSSPRSAVWRVELADGPAVVKQLVAGAGAEERYGRELAALRIASLVQPPVVPQLLGVDAGTRVLVLEYVEHGRPRPQWEVEYAAALARLHATAREGDGDGLPGWEGPDDEDIASFLAFAAALGADVPERVEDELAELVLRLGKAAARPALLHGDPCPGNDLHTADGIRFIDFEQACLGNGLMELAYLRIGFPTCCGVTAAPEPLLAEAEAAYRTAWRAATGTDVEGDLADACAGWLIRGDALVQRAHRGTVDQLVRVMDVDWEWGTVSARERLLHRLGVVARMAGGHEELGGLGRLGAEMRRRMRARWPGLRPVPERRL